MKDDKLCIAFCLIVPCTLLLLLHDKYSCSTWMEVLPCTNEVFLKQVKTCAVLVSVVQLTKHSEGPRYFVMLEMFPNPVAVCYGTPDIAVGISIFIFIPKAAFIVLLIETT